MNTIKFTQYFALLAMISWLTISCKTDDPIIENPEELITTLRYTLTPNDGSAAVVFEFRDIDGDGGTLPVYQLGNLKNGVQYEGNLILLNESVNPAEDISAEVKSEADVHLFFYKIDNSLTNALEVSYNDADANNKPIGLSTKLLTKQIGTGKMTITLKHEPNKSAAGLTISTPELAGGDTDIEVTFDVVVQ